MADIKEQADVLRTQWQSEKEALGRVQTIKAEIESTKHLIEQAERATDLQKAAELKYGKLIELEKSLKKEEDAFVNKNGNKNVARLIKEEIDEEDIADIVSKWTGIPVTKLLEGEVQKLLHLEEHLHERCGRPRRSHRSGIKRSAPGTRRLKRS